MRVSSVVGRDGRTLSIRGRSRRFRGQPALGELALVERGEQSPHGDDLLARARPAGQRAGHRLAEALEREVALEQRRAAALGGAHERARRLLEHLVVRGRGGRRERADPALRGGDALGIDEEARAKVAVQPAPAQFRERGPVALDDLRERRQRAPRRLGRRDLRPSALGEQPAHLGGGEAAMAAGRARRAEPPVVRPAPRGRRRDAQRLRDLPEAERRLAGRARRGPGGIAPVRLRRPPGGGTGRLEHARPDAARTHELERRVGRQRRREQLALRPVQAERAQQAQLLLGLDLRRGHRQAERVPDLDHRLDDRARRACRR